jgi:hypothetical protein
MAAVVGLSEYRYFANGVPLRWILADALTIPPFALKEAAVGAALALVLGAFCRSFRIKITDGSLTYTTWTKKKSWPLSEMTKVTLATTRSTYGSRSSTTHLCLWSGHKEVLSLPDILWRRGELRRLIEAILTRNTRLDLSADVRSYLRMNAGTI